MLHFLGHPVKLFTTMFIVHGSLFMVHGSLFISFRDDHFQVFSDHSFIGGQLNSTLNVTTVFLVSWKSVFVSVGNQHLYQLEIIFLCQLEISILCQLEISICVGWK